MDEYLKGVMNRNNPWDTTTVALAKPSWLTDEIKIALENNGLSQDQDGMILLQQRAKNQLDYWKEMEMKYRKVCAAFLVPNKTEGTNTIELGNGFQAKVGIKYNYKLDSNNDKVWEGLSKIESLGNEGKFVAERLVSWTPNFLLTEYRQLQEDAEKGSQFAKDALKEINNFLTIIPAAPTLEIKEPKKKKK